MWINSAFHMFTSSQLLPLCVSVFVCLFDHFGLYSLIMTAGAKPKPKPNPNVDEETWS